MPDQNTFSTNSLFKLRLYFTAIVTLGIWSLLFWNYSHGGIPSHHVLNRENLPEISNLWGGLLLPVLTWLLTWRLQQRLVRNRTADSTSISVPITVLYCFFGALLFGVLLSVFFALGYSSVVGKLMMSLFLLALFLPIYRVEYILGFVLGMTFMFGAVLPMGVALVFSVVGAVIYLFIRGGVLFVFKKRKRKG